MDSFEIIFDKGRAGGEADSRESGFLHPSKNRRHPCRRRAPGAERCEIFFWLLLGDCASSFLDGTDPSRKGEPQKLGRPLARTASSKGPRLHSIESFVARLGLVFMCQFSRRENIGCALVHFDLGEFAQTDVMSQGFRHPWAAASGKPLGPRAESKQCALFCKSSVEKVFASIE